MRTLAIILICLSAVGFVLAIISAVWVGRIAGVSAEGFSYGCTNLALMAIALILLFKVGDKGGDT